MGDNTAQATFKLRLYKPKVLLLLNRPYKAEFALSVRGD
jgi:hypothetical protein